MINILTLNLLHVLDVVYLIEINESQIMINLFESNDRLDFTERFPVTIELAENRVFRDAIPELTHLLQKMQEK